METEELIEHILRQKHLEEMMNSKHSVNHVANFVN